ncbi:hypothetical protein Tco_0562523 [Tanacetum coccineum]
MLVTVGTLFESKPPLHRPPLRVLEPQKSLKAAMQAGIDKLAAMRAGIDIMQISISCITHSPRLLIHKCCFIQAKELIVEIELLEEEVVNPEHHGLLELRQVVISSLQEHVEPGTVAFVDSLHEGQSSPKSAEKEEIQPSKTTSEVTSKTLKRPLFPDDTAEQKKIKKD